MDDSDFFLDEPLVTQARAGAKFQPKAKRKARDETSGSIASKLPDDFMKEEAATLASAGLDAVPKSSQVINPSQVAVSDSLLAEFTVPNCCDDTNSSFERSARENADLFFGLECLDQFLTQSSNNDGGIQIDYERTGTEEAGAFPDVETQDIMFDMTIASGRRAGKFKPKPRLQTSVVTTQPAVVESVMHHPNSQFVPSETMCGESSIPDVPMDDVPDCLPMDLGSFIPPDPSTTKYSANKELAILTEASNPYVSLSGDVPSMPKKSSSNIRQKKATPVSNPSRKSRQSFTVDEGNENGKATKQLRQPVNIPWIVDGPEDGTCNDDGIASELPCSSAIDEDKDDDDGDDEYNAESAYQKKGTTTRSKKPVNENEKPLRKSKIVNEAQKHKKVNEASDQPVKERPKKFSHTTHRKRRFGCYDFRTLKL